MTAYEMRISDWSSDVCSSDLEYFIASQMDISPDFRSWVLDDSRYLSFVNELNYYAGLERSDAELLAVIGDRFQKLTEVFFGELEWEPDLNMIDRRSEEHTSELQSLMRISYAVFCLKKKNINTTIIYHHSHNTRHPYQIKY